LVIAAESVASSVDYIRAAITLVQAEDNELIDRVVRGDVSLLAAAKQAKLIADLVAAYRAAGPEGVATLLRNRVTKFEQGEIGRHLGGDWTFDHLVVPAVDRPEAGQPQMRLLDEPTQEKRTS
jgi:hypothetical protein